MPQRQAVPHALAPLSGLLQSGADPPRDYGSVRSRVFSGSLNHPLALLGRNALPAPLRLVREREQLPVGHVEIVSSCRASVTTSSYLTRPRVVSRLKAG